MRFGAYSLAVLAVALTACETMDALTPSWFRGADRIIKRAPGERLDVLFSASQLTPDDSAKDTPIVIPGQANLTSWPNRHVAERTAHIGLTGLSEHQSVRIGDGNRFTRNQTAAPVISDGVVLVMDAAGVISAHDESDISKVLWTNDTGVSDEIQDANGGGVTLADGMAYATSGTGNVRALNPKDGKTKWSVSVGAPVRGAPAAGSGIVAVITADNQTFGLDIETGAVRWSHRGIREVAAYVSTVSPVIEDGMVIVAYSSGEVAALRAETGNLLWTDTLGASTKTRASAVFSGIDADPVVGEGAVVAISAAGSLQANALANGRPLWQKKIGGHNTPWSAGNAVFLISDTHDVAAVLKPDGAIRWAQSLAVRDERDKTRDVTPALYGPILAGNAVLVLDAKGVMTAFKPEDGSRLSTYELSSGTVSSPIIVNGALYYITKDARLHRYH